MSEFELRVTSVIVEGRSVRCALFIAPSKDQNFQRCGELTLTIEEARELQSKLEPEVSKLGQQEPKPINEYGFPIYPVGTPIEEVSIRDRGQKMIFKCDEHPEVEWASKDPFVSRWFGNPQAGSVCPCEWSNYKLSQPYSPTRNG